MKVKITHTYISAKYDRILLREILLSLEKANRISSWKAHLRLNEIGVTHKEPNVIQQTLDNFIHPGSLVINKYGRSMDKIKNLIRAKLALITKYIYGKVTTSRRIL